MDTASQTPKLEFFRSVPEDLMSRPPLCASLQNLESSLSLIGLRRFPHALVLCASAIESAMKSSMGLSPDDRIGASQLYATACQPYPALASWDGADLDRLRFSRNRIVHYGFSPADDHESAALLLSAGYPFLTACYRAFFGFELEDGLAADIGEHLGVAVQVYLMARDTPNLGLVYCFRALGHRIRWRFKEDPLAGWEADAISESGQTIGLLDRWGEDSRGVHCLFGAAWEFTCPVCRGCDTFVCELDEERLQDRTISLVRGQCPGCGFAIPAECPFLADALCRDQVEAQREEILRDYGIPPR